MKLRILLGHIAEAEEAGDLQGRSPVFAVVRNEGAHIKSSEAWHAISIIGAEDDAETGAVDLIADGAEDAKDITVATLRAVLSRLPGEALEHEVFVRSVAQDDDEGGQEGDSALEAPVVEAYGDEHGLGLMLWFEGYEDWIPTQN